MVSFIIGFDEDVSTGTSLKRASYFTAEYIVSTISHYFTRADPVVERCIDRHTMMMMISSLPESRSIGLYSIVRYSSEVVSICSPHIYMYLLVSNLNSGLQCFS